MDSLIKVLQQAKEQPFIMKRMSNGAHILNQKERKELRTSLKNALCEDLNDSLPCDVGEALVNSDNLMLLFYTRDDVLVTVEIDIKIKNLDYVPYEDE